MIGYISGTILSLTDSAQLTTAVVNVSGIGYEVHMPSRSASGLSEGKDCSFHIYTHLRADGRSESSLELYGFSSSWEKQVFLLLTSVSGIGFKTALSILSGIDARTILQAIVRQDRVTLSAVPGVGKKTVERIFLEISEKASKLLMKTEGAASGTAAATTKTSSAKTSATKNANTQDADVWIEAQQALVALGYREVDAASVLRDVFKDNEGKDLSLQGFITGALKKLKTL